MDPDVLISEPVAISTRVAPSFIRVGQLEKIVLHLIDREYDDVIDQTLATAEKRAWFVVPAYQQATAANYAPLRELQDVMTRPYAEQSKDVEEKYYSLKPPEFFEVGGLSYYSCSS